MKSSARLNKEYGDLTNNPVEGVEISYQGEEITKWDVRITGKCLEGTAYEAGNFMLEMDFSDNYPFKAPKVLFKTKIYHPNVKTDTGEICTQAIEKSWVPTQNAKYVIESLISLIVSPRPEDALEQDIAEQYTNDNDAFVSKVKEYIQQHSSISNYYHSF